MYTNSLVQSGTQHGDHYCQQFGTEKFKLEKAIYRLSQLGIVSDWVIEDFLMERSMSSSSAYRKKDWKEN
jgi:hypothetical protein